MAKHPQMREAESNFTSTLDALGERAHGRARILAYLIYMVRRLIWMKPSRQRIDLSALRSDSQPLHQVMWTAFSAIRIFGTKSFGNGPAPTTAQSDMGRFDVIFFTSLTSTPGINSAGYDRSTSMPSTPVDDKGRRWRRST